MTTIAVENLTPDLIQELETIVRNNWDETGDGFGIDLDVDWDAYLLLAETGDLRFFVCRDDGVIVGYSVFVITRYPRSKHVPYAMQDTIYVLPKYRVGGLGIRLVRFIEDELRKDGVQLITQAARSGTAFDKVLRHNGYELTHHNFLKRL